MIQSNRFVWLARFGFWLLGVALMVGAWADPRFRDSEGFLKATILLPFVIGIAVILFGWAMATRLNRCAFWLALVLVGQAVALQMIDAGPLLHYQHYKPFERLFVGTNLLLLIFLATQASIVFVAIWGRWSKIKAWSGSNLRVWQILGVALVFILSSAAAQRDIFLYLGDLLLATFVQFVNLANIVLVVCTIPEGTLSGLKRRFGNIFASLRQDAGGVDRFAMFVAIWVFALAAFLSLVIYESHPHITDEVVYLYQARFFANGSLTLPAPPVPEAFDFYLEEIKGDRWYLPTSPGWPAILAIGVRLGIPGLVNPLLAGINILLIYILLNYLYDLDTARIALLLLAISPWYVFMAMNLMTHMLTLTCALLAAVGIVQSRKTGKARWGWLAGLAVGAGTLIRPLDGAIVGGLIGLWAVGIGGRRLKGASIAALAVGAILVGAVILPYNQTLTGSPTVFPLNAYTDSRFGPGTNDLGFGPNRGFGWPLQPFPGHSPLGAMINANLNTFSINVELFGWSIGSLIFVALLLFSRSLGKSDYLLLAVCSSVFVPFFFYYYSGGPDFGARYWFLMLIPLVALTARGIQWLQSTLEFGGTRIMAAVVLLSTLTLVNYFPWRSIDKYHHFWGMRPDVVALAKQFGFGKSLVLIRGNESHPDFASAAIYNPLDWNADAPIYAWDRNPTVRAQLLQAFADRLVWIVDAPSLTHAGYKVFQGPLLPRDLISQ